jgi:hypothetical protein
LRFCAGANQMLSRRDSTIVARHEVPGLEFGRSEAGFHFVPEGHAIVARRFIAGFRGTRIGVSRQAHRLSYFFLMGTNHPLNRYAYTPIRRSVSPGGLAPTSSVPPGRRSYIDGLPGEKSPGYYRASLRDEAH